jgi:hypothetical protein
MNTVGSGWTWSRYVGLELFAGLGICGWLCSKIGLGIEVRPASLAQNPVPDQKWMIHFDLSKVGLHEQWSLVMLRRTTQCDTVRSDPNFGNTVSTIFHCSRKGTFTLDLKPKCDILQKCSTFYTQAFSNTSNYVSGICSYWRIGSPSCDFLLVSKHDNYSYPVFLNKSKLL